ncbi:hypothetical protein ACIQB5_51580 [Streptomyces sp. NPDC088560]|uniref:hypothetical protein n=1 Tax=Streptomyces sp. NPDC088560 TaxID=3365868 RepID=UPI00381A713A
MPSNNEGLTQPKRRNAAMFQDVAISFSPDPDSKASGGGNTQGAKVAEETYTWNWDTAQWVNNTGAFLRSNKGTLQTLALEGTPALISGLGAVLDSTPLKITGASLGGVKGVFNIYQKSKNGTLTPLSLAANMATMAGSASSAVSAGASAEKIKRASDTIATILQATGAVASSAETHIVNKYGDQFVPYVQSPDQVNSQYAGPSSRKSSLGLPESLRRAARTESSGARNGHQSRSAGAAASSAVETHGPGSRVNSR